VDIDVSIVKIIILAALSIPLAIRALSKSRRPRLSLDWSLATLLFIVIVLHNAAFGTSLDDQTGPILIAGAAILNLGYWAGNAIEAPRTIFAIEQVLTVAAAIFVAMNLWPPLLLDGDNYPEGNYIGLLSNSNMLGGYVTVLCAPLLASAVLSAQGPYRRWLYTGLLAGALGLILITRSRASMLAIAAGIFFVIAMEERLGRRLKVGVLAGVLAATAALILTLSDKYQDISLTGTRDVLFEQRITAIAERPLLGWGFNADVASFHYEISAFPAMEKGNTVLQALEEFGLPLGTVVMLAIVALVWRVARDLRRKFGDRGFSMMVIAALAHLMFETWLFNFQSILSIGIWLVMLTGSYVIRLERDPGPSPLPTPASPPRTGAAGSMMGLG
jgi:O-antigen ligase